jgi:hypothetical protein
MMAAPVEGAGFVMTIDASAWNCRPLGLSLSFVFLLTSLATSSPQSATSQKSDAQESFELLKTLAGSWKGQGPEGPVRVSLRVTSVAPRCCKRWF